MREILWPVVAGVLYAFSLAGAFYAGGELRERKLWDDGFMRTTSWHSDDLRDVNWEQISLDARRERGLKKRANELKADREKAIHDIAAKLRTVRDIEKELGGEKLELKEVDHESSK